MFEIGQSGPFKEFDSNILAKRIFEYTNSIRSIRRFTPLEWDQKLADIAFGHSKDMCLNRFFDHVNLWGETSFDRVEKRYPGRYAMIGENLFKIDTNWDIIQNYNDIHRVVEELMADWMDSPGHRENILRPEFDLLGVGVYATEDDIFATQLFGKLF